MSMHKPARQLFDFGLFRLDPAERLLLLDGRPVPLEPKVFETLLVLIQDRGRLVEKDELMKKVWPDSFVEESNLTRNISVLRKALGESVGGQQYIETVPKRGYRFVAGVREWWDEGAELLVQEHVRTQITIEDEVEDEGVKGRGGEGVPEALVDSLAHPFTPSPLHPFTRSRRRFVIAAGVAL